MKSFSTINWTSFGIQLLSCDKLWAARKRNEWTTYKTNRDADCGNDFVKDNKYLRKDVKVRIYKNIITHMEHRPDHFQNKATSSRDLYGNHDGTEYRESTGKACMEVCNGVRTEKSPKWGGEE